MTLHEILINLNEESDQGYISTIRAREYSKESWDACSNEFIKLMYQNGMKNETVKYYKDIIYQKGQML